MTEKLFSTLKKKAGSNVVLSWKDILKNLVTQADEINKSHEVIQHRIFHNASCSLEYLFIYLYLILAKSTITNTTK